MELINPRHVEAAVSFLLRLLLEEGKVPLEYFYDGKKETAERLAAGMGMSFDDAVWYRADKIMEAAVATLEAFGFVTVNERGGTLANGKQAYEVVLPADGAERLKA